MTASDSAPPRVLTFKAGTCAAKVVATLLQVLGEVNGHTHVYGFPGESHALLTQYVEGMRPLDVPGAFRVIGNVNEGPAIAAASAQARATGHPSLALVTRAHGLLAAADQIYQADGVPMVVVAGIAPYRLYEGRAPEDHMRLTQHLDVEAVFDPITRGAFMAHSAEEAAQKTCAAFAAANGAHKGPTILGLPTDVMTQPLARDLEIELPDLSPDTRIAEGVERFLWSVSSSNRRVLVAAGGALSYDPEGYAALHRFLDSSGAAAVTLFREHDQVSQDHPAWAGSLHIKAWTPAVEQAVREAETILFVGAPITQEATKNFDRGIFRGKKLYMLHTDADAAQRTGYEVRPLTGGLASTLDYLARNVTHPSRQALEWRDGLHAQGRELLSYRAPIQGDLHLPDIIRAINAYCAENGIDPIFVTDAGNHAYHADTYGDVSRRNSLFTPVRGGMGYAFGAAIGARLGARLMGRDPVVFAVVGNGAAGYSPTEIATVGHYGIGRIVYLIVNDHALGAIRTATEAGGLANTQILEPAEVDYVGLTRACGAWAEQITRQQDVPGLIDHAVRQSGKGHASVLVCDVPYGDNALPRSPAR